jgi:hypothetical protein
VVLVRDDPAAALLAQPDGQPEAVVWVLLELLIGPATKLRGAGTSPGPPEDSNRR